MTPDVVVIGGGPAGLAAAIVLARRGVETVLVERGEFPVDKPCGEGLLPNGVAALERLGLARTELEPHGHPIAGIRYVSQAQRIAETRFVGATGLGLRRTELSRLLHARATALPALRIASRTRAEVRLIEGERPEVTMGDERLRPRLVIGADGLTSHVRRSCGIPIVIHSDRRWGMRRHFDITPWTDHVEVYFANDVEAYVTPLERGINVACLWRQEHANAEPRHGAFEAFIRDVPALARRLAGASPTDRALASGPFRQQPVERSRDGLLLMGDAAGYVDAITGEGVGLALAQAEVLEQAVAPLFAATRSAAAPVITAAQLRPYLADSDAACRSNRDLTRLLLMLSRHPWMVERVIRALSRDPALFQHCLRANMGLTSLWRLPMKSVLTVVRAMIR
jgi:flavin-dependent dehydrogenase